MKTNSISPCLILILCLSYSGQCFAKTQENVSADSEMPTITVTGLAEIKAVPDQANMTFHILIQEKEYEPAQKEHDRQMKLAKKILTESGIETRDIQTGGVFRSYSFYYYWYHYRHRNQFQISVPISVRIRDLSKMESIYVKLNEAGLKVPTIKFASSKLQDYRRQAFADAVKAARTKAEIMTGALDQKIGKAIKIAEDHTQNRYWYGSPNVANVVSSAPNGGQSGMQQFSGGEVTISAKVKIVFELQ